MISINGEGITPDMSADYDHPPMYRGKQLRSLTPDEFERAWDDPTHHGDAVRSWLSGLFEQSRAKGDVKKSPDGFTDEVLHRMFDIKSPEHLVQIREELEEMQTEA